VKLLVIGQGLLGKGVLSCEPEPHRFPVTKIQWQDSAQARQQLAEVATTFGRSVDGPWRVAWCAGAGVVGTSDVQFADEQSYLESFLTDLRTAIPAGPTAGGLFFASSAGGVFGLGSSALITEGSSESPASAYGRSKLAQERMISDWSMDTAVPALIGRVSNLYGAGQNLGKPQGFISQLLRSMLVKRPFRLGVSGDTERDFIHVDDAAARIHRWLHLTAESGVTCKLIAAGQSHTLLRVASIVRSVTRIQPKIMYAATAGSGLQPRHLRFVSEVRNDLDDAVPSRPLEIGISQTWHSMLSGFANGAFA
jgi:UDP-glucose 4-epimerase